MGVAGGPLALLTVFDFTIQWFMFVISATWKTEKFYDITGSCTFISLAYLCYQWSPVYSLRQSIQAAMVSIWATRLGLFLFTRIMKAGKDRRFEEARENLGLLFALWTLQGLWIIITILPTLMLLLSKRDSPLNNRDYIGWSLWVLGFFFEVTADYQKSVFRNNLQNKGHFINTGLWSVSRHPNYFGEIIMWFGLYLSASSVLRGYELLAVLCPVFDMILITRISGIPILERYGILKWGHLPSYQEYLKNTAVLIPFIW